ncbi:MAG: tetratricopeptide repeat protein, partial [Campylobacter sp.]|nr:tetratricopeptide repeat protein [Campylobacter sp.]
MKKLFLFFIYLTLSLNLLAQTEQIKQKDIYTKDFLGKFAQALYLEKENPKEAIKIYEELYSQTPQDITLLKSLAALCFQIDDKPCAQKYIPLYLNEAPNDYQALALNAQLAWQKGNLKEAQEYYSKALKSGELSQEVLLQYLTLLNTIDKDEAVKFLRQLEQENNLLAMPINLEIAQIYLNQNQPEKAILTLDKAIKKYPQTREFYLAKARIYEIQKDINKMLKVYAQMDSEGLLTEEDLVKIG